MKSDYSGEGLQARDRRFELVTIKWDESICDSLCSDLTQITTFINCVKVSSYYVRPNGLRLTRMDTLQR